MVLGYGPFAGQPINPAWELARQLPESIGKCQIMTGQLPVVWFEAYERMQEQIALHKPDSVLCLGQAGNWQGMFVERVGINLCEGPKDNKGIAYPVGIPLVEGAPTAYFTSTPYTKMIQAMQNEDIPCKYSYSAGAYLCNTALYGALHIAATQYPHMTAGFIHVPTLPEQEWDRPMMSMPFDLQMRAITLCLEAIASTLED